MMILSMPRDLTRRERVADWLFVGLQIGSRLAFVVFGVLGYFYQGVIAAVVCGAVGFLVGIWFGIAWVLEDVTPLKGSL